MGIEKFPENPKRKNNFRLILKRVPGKTSSGIGVPAISQIVALVNGFDARFGTFSPKSALPKEAGNVSKNVPATAKPTRSGRPCVFGSRGD